VKADPVLGSRGMMYDAVAGMDLTPPLPVIDRGVSRSMDVSDYIANTFARVQGVGINFDGELAAIKGDSTYVFDRTLRLQGIFQSRGSTGGLDFHPMNRGLNTGDLRTRLAFVASSEPVIEIYDSWCFKRVGTVPIRDPIIGPVRASLRSDGAIVLVGATIRGVTLVQLPTTSPRPATEFGCTRAGRHAPRSRSGARRVSRWRAAVCRAAAHRRAHRLR
jgi:hypothetical protein